MSSHFVGLPLLKESDSDDVVRMRFVHINDVYVMDNLCHGCYTKIVTPGRQLGEICAIPSVWRRVGDNGRRLIEVFMPPIKYLKNHLPH